MTLEISPTPIKANPISGFPGFEVFSETAENPLEEAQTLLTASTIQNLYQLT